MAAQCCSVYHILFMGDLAKLPGNAWLWPSLPGLQKPLVGWDMTKELEALP